MQLLVQNMTLDSLKRKENEYGSAYLIPVERWLRSQLDDIENFVQQQVDVSIFPNPNNPHIRQHGYKPLWRGNTMYVSVAPWCHHMQQNEESGQVMHSNIDFIIYFLIYELSFYGDRSEI